MNNPHLQAMADHLLGNEEMKTRPCLACSFRPPYGVLEAVVQASLGYDQLRHWILCPEGQKLLPGVIQALDDQARPKRRKEMWEE